MNGADALLEINYDGFQPGEFSEIVYPDEKGKKTIMILNCPKIKGKVKIVTTFLPQTGEEARQIIVVNAGNIEGGRPQSHSFTLEGDQVELKYTERPSRFLYH